MAGLVLGIGVCCIMRYTPANDKSTTMHNSVWHGMFDMTYHKARGH